MIEFVKQDDRRRRDRDKQLAFLKASATAPGGASATAPCMLLLLLDTSSPVALLRNSSYIELSIRFTV